MTSGAMSARVSGKAGQQLCPEQAAAAAMVAEARARGLELTGPNGLLKLFTKNVLEAALGEEMTEHLGHEKNCADAGRESTNVRNGTRSKTVVSDAVGEVCIDVPRDREGTFAPKIVKKRQRRLTDVDEIVLSLYAKGLTTGEISAHFAEIYGASVSKETISRITDKVVAEMQEWAARPLDAVYVTIFIDAIVVKVRDGQVANRPVYAAIGVTVEGRKDVLGLWAGTGGEGAKFWMSVLVDLKNRGVRDVFFLVCDGGERIARGRGERVAAHYCPNLHHPSYSEYVPVDLPQGRRCHQARYQTHLHRAEPCRRARCIGRAGGEMGNQIRCDDTTVAHRVDRIRALPRLRYRDQENDLLDQRNRITERTIPQGSAGTRTFSQRAGRAEMPVPCDPQPRPYRDRPRAMDDPLAACGQRLRHHLQ